MERGILGSPPLFFFHLWPLDLDLEIFVLDLDLDHEIFALDLAIFEDVVNSADPLVCISAYSTGF